MPQGPVLGPVCFLLLINDLRQFLQNLGQVVMYADDTFVTLGDNERDRVNTKTQAAHNLQHGGVCSRGNPLLALRWLFHDTIGG